MRPSRVLLLCAAVFLASCASAPESPPAPATPSPPEAELLQPTAPAKCPHIWMQSGTHAYQPSDSMVPELCVVNRCMKCGAQRHECSRRRR